MKITTTIKGYAPENYSKEKASALVTKQNRYSLKFFMLLLLFVGVSVSGWGQVTLTTSPYTQDFNTTTLPTGWTTRHSATNSTLGTSVLPATTDTWASTTSGFKFIASGKSPLSSSSSTTAQNAATDRCLAVRSSGSFGDPGQAFTLQIENTIGFTNFSLTFNAQLLDVQGRTTTYRVEYGLGSNPTSWTLVGSTFTDKSVNSGIWGTTNITRSFGTALDNQSGNVWIRISCLVAATGSGSRCTFGIDDVSLNFSTGSTPPSLTAASNPTVDAPFDVTFTDDAASQAWLSAGGTSVTVGGTSLTAGYAITNGKITFTPSASSPAGLLQTAGANKSIVISKTGYTNATVSQTILAGAASKLSISTQPTAPSTNGGNLAIQPTVRIQDHYGNTTTSTAEVTATVDAGSWTLGGTVTRAAVSGTATFSGLTATSLAAISGATISFSSSGLTGFSSNAFNIPAPVITLTAAIGASVDNTFEVTFTDNASWRAAITSITVGGTSLASAAYVVSDGKITFNPSESTLLQTSGSKSITVIATGYNNTSVSQSIIAGAATKLGISTQPTASPTNGGNLTIQPIVRIQDQYGNTTTSTAEVTATVDAGSWTLGGTVTRAAVSGTATFSGLTATSLAAISGATISFSSSGLTGISSNAFNIPAPVIALTAAIGASVDNTFEVTFTDNASWRAAITSITVGGTSLASAAYVVSDGKITFNPSESTLLQTSGSKSITVIATGYNNTSLSQSIIAGAATKLGISTQPTAPPTNGGNLTIQPIVRIQDQYGNTTTSTAEVTATVGAGSWTLGGTITRAAVSGTVTFSALTASSSEGIIGATIEFSSGSLTSFTSNPFNIPVLVAAPSTTTNLSFGSLTHNGFSLSFNAPASIPTGYLVLRRTSSAVSGSPSAGIVYTVGQTNIGAGINEVIYVGSSVLTAFAQTGFTDNTTYHYAIYAYNGSGIQTNYSTALIGSATTSIFPAPNAISATTISNSGFIANWNAVSGASEYKIDLSVFENFGTLSNFVAWTFPENGTILTPDISNSNNTSKTLTTNSSPISDAQGATTQAASANNWQSGSGSKFWQVDVNTTGYVDIKISSKQRSSGTGPRDFKLQYKVGNGSWFDVVGGTIAITTTDFTTGILDNLSLPSECDNQESLSIRWLMNSNTSQGGGTVASTGTNRIDDIVITGIESQFTGVYNNLSVATTSQEVTGLTPNTNYYYRVRAVGGNSTSANSNVVTVLTLPAAPVASAASTVNALNFVANWTLPVTGADSYTLDVATDEDFNNKLEAYNNLTVTGTSQAISGLSRNTTYYYRVKSLNASGASVSNVISVSTGNAITVTGSNESAGSLADCVDCDLVVNQGGHLTVNANKSFNSVTLKPGAKLTLNNGQTFAPGTFVLESNASNTATFVDKRTHANKTDITATVQQHLPAASNRLWWYLASPVDGASYTVFGSNKVGDYSEANRSYSSPFAAPTTLTAGKGYVVKMTAESAANYIFSNKTLNTGDISIGVTRTVTETADNAKRGFNLVGNPYPSYLNWDMAYNASTNVRPTIWYRTLVYDEGSTSYKMDFHTYNASLNVAVPTSVSEYIPPMQAFWVKVNTDPVSPLTVSNGTLNFRNDMRSHDLSALGNPLKAPAADRQLVRLSISNGTMTDETVIATHPLASDNYDRYDSEKMANNDVTRPEIFTLAGSQELVINGISPITDSKQINLGVRPGRAGNYTIALTEWRNEGNLEVVLRDNEGEELILTESNNYSFSIGENASTTRFSLLFRAKGSTTGFDNVSSHLQVYAFGKTISIESAGLTGKVVSVYNTIGQPVYSATAESNRLEISGLAPAVYLVKVNNQTKMVIVK